MFNLIYIKLNCPQCRWEKYDAKGWTEKGAHKYGRLNEQSWWEKWGEHYDGRGSILKWYFSIFFSSWVQPLALVYYHILDASIMDPPVKTCSQFITYIIAEICFGRVKFILVLFIYLCDTWNALKINSSFGTYSIKCWNLKLICLLQLFHVLFFLFPGLINGLRPNLELNGEISGKKSFLLVLAHGKGRRGMYLLVVKVSYKFLF